MGQWCFIVVMVGTMDSRRCSWGWLVYLCIPKIKGVSCRELLFRFLYGGEATLEHLCLVRCTHVRVLGGVRFSCISPKLKEYFVESCCFGFCMCEATLRHLCLSTPCWSWRIEHKGYSDKSGMRANCSGSCCSAFFQVGMAESDGEM